MADKLPTNLSQLMTLPQTGSSLMPFLRGAGSGLSMGLSEPIGASLASLFAAKGNPLEAYRIYPEMRGIVEEQRAGLEQQSPGKTMNPKASANVDELLRLRGQLDASLETKGVMSDFDYYQQMNDVVNRFMK